MSELLLIKNGTLIVGDQAEIKRADLLVRDGRIAEIGTAPFTTLTADDQITTIDATDRLISPGFIQTHIHLCQTIFRGAADDLELLDWLRMRVWPMEAAHNPASLTASANLAVAELIKSGTTAALTMETVHDTETVLTAVAQSGFRATIGKCMMDKGNGVPARMQERTADSLAEIEQLLTRWSDPQARVRCCYAPRFAISCTRELLEAVAQMAARTGTIVHTHASENRHEIEIVSAETGLRNIKYLAQVGLAGNNVALAHCVHVDEREQQLLAETGTQVLHCPSSNLKLGSGIAPIAEMLTRGVSISLGADGAACNNNLDIFVEMRLAALLQKMRCGSDRLPARTAFQMATLAGARALGLAHEIGTIEVGKRADLVILNLNQLHCTPAPDPISTLVYAAHGSDVETVIIDGRIVMRDRVLQTIDESETIATARAEYQALIKRAGI